MYFESFPTVEYTNVLNGDKRIVTNILKRISAREAVKKNLAVFRKYTVKSSDSPESLAYDLYGTPRLWWVLAQRNPDQIEDPIYDFRPGVTIQLPKKENVLKDLGV